MKPSVFTIVLLVGVLCSCKAPAPVQQDPLDDTRKLLTNKTWQLVRRFDPYWSFALPPDSNRGRVVNGSLTIYNGNGTGSYKGSSVSIFDWYVFAIPKDSADYYIVADKPMMWSKPRSGDPNIFVPATTEIIMKLTADSLVLGRPGPHGVVTETYVAR
jgi:hypothetical protein